MQYWLFKTEPTSFGIQDLKECKNKTEPWDGVRNYQARNFMKDKMRLGDLGFLYHSSCKTPGIVGIIKIVKTAYPDYTAFDSNSKYYCSKSNPDKPRWFMVDVKLEEEFNDIISLQKLKEQQELQNMQILKKGNRLSITPVLPEDWRYICEKLKP